MAVTYNYAKTYEGAIIGGSVKLGFIRFHAPVTGTIKKARLRIGNRNLFGIQYYNMRIAGGAYVWDNASRMESLPDVEDITKSGLSIAVTEGQLVEFDMQQKVGSAASFSPITLILEIEVEAQFQPLADPEEVADETARFALTDKAVGDIIKQTDTGTTYVVIDAGELDNDDGYLEIGDLEDDVIEVADQTARFALTDLDEGDIVRQTGNGRTYAVIDITNLGNSAGWIQLGDPTRVATSAANQTARFALTGLDIGDIVTQTDTGKSYVVTDPTNLNNSSGWLLVGDPTQVATSVANQAARFALTDLDVGDIVKQTDTAISYVVIDPTNLGNSAGWLSLGGASGITTACDVQTFSYTGATQTWTKPSGAKAVEVLLWGGGGGGGGGAWFDAGAGVQGGIGGGGGGFIQKTFNAADLSGTEDVIIGAGGTHGNGATAVNTNGTDGTQGGNTTFGTTVKLAAGGGGGGQKGLAAASTRAGAEGGAASTNATGIRGTTGAAANQPGRMNPQTAAGGNFTTPCMGNSGGGNQTGQAGVQTEYGGASSSSNPSLPNGSNSIYGGPSGGQGGPCSSGAPGNGGQGGLAGTWDTTNGGGGGAAGTGSATVPTNGTAGSAGAGGRAGNGGGGGGGTTGTNIQAGAGAAGGTPAAGGGGGGSKRSFTGSNTAGNGGDGGNGYAIVITYL